MTEWGLMATDWEERINFDRMRRYRLERAKQALAESDADVLLVMRAEDIRYLTGNRHHLGPVTRFGSEVAILPKGGDPILYIMDYATARIRMPWMPKESIREGVNWREYVGVSEWAKDVQQHVGDMRGKKLGVDQLTVTMIDTLKQVFPETGLVDGYQILNGAKTIKSEDEVECLKAATIITEAGMDAALRILKPGVRECELLAEAWKTFTALGSEWTQCANIVSSGPFTAPYHRRASDRIIRMGDLVILDIGGCYMGYWGDLTRTWICGDIDATEEQKELHQKSYDALFNACAACVPGNTNVEVVDAAEPYVFHVLGHCAGVNPWEPPFFTSGSHDAPVTLQEGMVINLEPYAGEPGIGGFRLENNLVVRADGPEIFTTYPFDERLVLNFHPLDPTTARARRYRVGDVGAQG
jgi:Xaa-Pro aminopeptidase